MNSNWYESFFHGLALELWRRAATPEMTLEEVELLVFELGVKPGGRLLDIPCGNGRHALEMASRGYSVTGYDISPEYIAEASASAASKGLDATFHVSDMCSIGTEELFDGAWCMGNSFGYLSHENTIAFLRGVAASIRKGSRFILETRMSAECFLSKFQGERVLQVGDIKVTIENHYDATQSRLGTDYLFEQGGESEMHSSEHQIYTMGEIRRMLTAAGFDVVAIYGSTKGEAFTLNSPDAVFVAQRNQRFRRATTGGSSSAFG